METWIDALDVFSSRLCVRETTEDATETRPADTQAIEALKKSIREYINSHRGVHDIGNTITFAFYVGKLRGGAKHHGPALVQSCSSALSEVLNNLPTLPDGSSYVFYNQSILSLTQVAGSGEDEDFVLENLCC